MRPLRRLTARRQLRLRAHLRRAPGVFKLGIAEHDIAVRAWGLVDLRTGHHEEDVLRSAEGDTLDAGDALETEAFERFAGLAFGSGLDVDGRAGLGGVLQGESLE